MPSRAKRIMLTLCGALASAGVIVSAVPGPAQAASSAPDGITTVALAQSKTDKQKVVDWWTPDRLKHASSYTPRTSSGGGATPRPSSTATTSAATPAAALAGSATSSASGKASALNGVVPPKAAPKSLTSRNVNLPPTVGKVFFRIGDAEYWCSASSLHSPRYGNLVATAGHCAYDVKQAKPVEYWVFIPAYTGDGATPYGIYVGHTLHLNERYAATGDFDFDYAFVTVHHGYRWDLDKNTDGTPKKDPKGMPVYKVVDTGRLESNVGGQGFAWNRGHVVAAYAFGYPAGPHPDGTRPYTGRRMESCLTRATSKISTQKWELDGGVLFGKCAFTAGASGGPWLIKYSGVKRLGYLNGVNSLTWDLNGDGKYDGISSPYFNTATYQVYAYAIRQKTD
ncbi:serine protease [Sphaerisporangium sp. B11E5]|uniref:trypsin-like serine peptidase n=1 Tax=Sphaerisporangium sp. B11E5 TaxID=3153563 RepID=UPI00325E76C9